ncbi:hypothetical protein JH06_3908 [Blastocystis sp. subtype 4]|uniref:hypothetical protein n=1 Tax=Blastocystis sp. subtype 4 TaxID=944170 RepID=UPI000711E9EB|nr:hypothetical protein JH06_3908 [Blastocystis sp. subtype 4]KNB42369.1 hypothetical protein JH06_3908 [Blastocystis sp. subtype 4]|eukprot:XP_014525812.1 hypothetical protein JH06_3908 [Blastocystis sp. subtype 4]
MSISECRYYIDQHVAAQWADDTYRHDYSGIVQQIREKVNENGSKEYEYYIHYVDYDKRMEGWVSASRISPLNKKSMKRLRDVDCSYSDKVFFIHFI